MPAPSIQVVVLVAGADDREAAVETEKVLYELGVAHEVVEHAGSAVSLRVTLENAVERGARVIIAFAGDDIRLPERAAQCCSRPVIGVPLSVAALHLLGNLPEGVAVGVADP